MTFEAVSCFILDGKSPLDVGARQRYSATIFGSERLPHLQRSERLKNDLARLSGRKQLDPPVQEPLSRETDGVTRHIQQSLLREPHIVLADAWVMYMALFNGVRWMGRQLLNAGEAFWNRSGLEHGATIR